MKSLRPLIDGVFNFMEIWKDVKGYEGLYQVNYNGQIRNIKKNFILKQTLCVNGYLIVGLRKCKKAKATYVHHVVAAAFFNHTPSGKLIHIDHIDNNKLNNSGKNLQIITARQNIVKSIKKIGKYTGVTYMKRDGTWYAKIKTKGVTKSLGYFKTEYEAHLAYQKELKKIGETLL